MDLKQNKKMRFEQVEKILSSGLSIKAWCKENKVSVTTMQRWMKIYKEEHGQDLGRSWIELSGREVSKAAYSTEAQQKTLQFRIFKGDITIEMFLGTATEELGDIVKMLAAL